MCSNLDQKSSVQFSPVRLLHCLSGERGGGVEGGGCGREDINAKKKLRLCNAFVSPLLHGISCVVCFIDASKSTKQEVL